MILNIHLYKKTEKLLENNLVTEVIDGDSFILKTDQTIRLDNLDAPELKYCGGPEAKKRLEELVLGKIVEYEISAFDTFHRPIAQVYVNGKFVNEIMLKEGLARYDSTSKFKREVLKKAFCSVLKRRPKKPDLSRLQIALNFITNPHDLSLFLI